MPTVVIGTKRVLGDGDGPDILHKHGGDAGIPRSARKENHPGLGRVGIGEGAVGLFEAPEESGIVLAPNGAGRDTAGPVARERPGDVL